jgi:hypothetical protein
MLTVVPQRKAFRLGRRSGDQQQLRMNLMGLRQRHDFGRTKRRGTRGEQHGHGREFRQGERCCDHGEDVASPM